VLALTFASFIGKVALLEPAGTVILEATIATSGGILRRVIVVSSVEARFTSVTVPVIVLPPTMERAEIVKEDMPGAAGSTSSVADFVTCPDPAEIATEVALVTFVVVIINCVEVLPCGMLTLAGTDATFGSELDNANVMPAAGAGPLRRNVPLPFCPPPTLAGERVNWDRLIG
jgi:hypothetical protein